MCQPDRASAICSFGAGVVTMNVSAVAVAVLAQLPAQHAVRLGGELDETRRVERADRPGRDGAVALLVVVQPAQPHPPAADEVDLGLASQPRSPPGLGDRRPHAVDRVGEPALVAQHVTAVAGLERAVGGVGV